MSGRESLFTETPVEEHDAEYHEGVESETGCSCRHPECLALEVGDE